VFATGLCLGGFAQVRLTLEQAGSRNGPDFTPVYEGKDVIVRGQISAKPLWALDVYYLAIQDEAEYGLLLEGGASQFNGFEPGDWIEVTGTIGRRAGMPVLSPREIHTTGRGMPPAPQELRLEQLNSFRYLGVLVVAQGQVSSAWENSGGDVLSLGEGTPKINVFLPKLRRNGRAGLQGYRPGDVVRATGISTQYCTLPPYDRSYQILLANPGSLILVDKAWLIPPSMLLTALFMIMALLALWSWREGRMANLRRALRTLNSLGEDVIAAASPREIVRKIIGVLSKLMRVSGAGIFVSNRQTQALDCFLGEGTAGEYGERLGAPILEAATAAFRNRTLLAVPDTRRSPLFNSTENGAPRSALFVPMFAQAELVGILEVEQSDRVQYFTREQHAALQHLANQVAAALKLQEQQSIREQLFRTEKLAAAAQLMSGIANELRSPLESIGSVAVALRKRCRDADPEISLIAVEANSASEIVQRLLALSRAEESEGESVDLNDMLTEVADLHEPVLRSKNIAIRRRLSKEPLIALGSREQLTQVMLNLLIYAEQCLDDGRASSEISVGSGLLAHRAMIEVCWPARTEAELDRAVDRIEKTGLSLEVCRGIIHSHGGELRVSHLASDIRFELELPLIESRQAEAPDSPMSHAAKRQLTILVVEPEAVSQRHVVSTLTALGHRVVPVASAEEGVDLAERMRFDLAVCALRLTGLSWADFLERVRSLVGGVVLLTNGYDPTLIRTFKSSDVFVLSKPADPAEIKHICETIESCDERSAAAR
jgi:nitrogen-specific signal transduction histidine kinase/ActR/RegA family two-component response regulator